MEYFCFVDTRCSRVFAFYPETGMTPPCYKMDSIIRELNAGFEIGGFTRTRDLAGQLLRQNTSGNTYVFSDVANLEHA